MTAKEYLQQLQKADVIIHQRMQEREELRAKLFSIGSFDYSKEHVQTSLSAGAEYERRALRMIDLENEIDGLIDDYVGLKHKIIGQIHGLKDNKHIEILYKKYVEGKRLEEVSVEMNYTFQYVVLLHGYALKEFSKKYSIYFQC